MSDMTAGELSHTTALVRIAYWLRLDDLPETVDDCTVWTRFLLNAIPWMAFNIGLWFLLGVVLGVIGQPLLRIGLFICKGKTLRYEPTIDLPLWLVGRD